MTLPGGSANKLGNRYEELWTVWVLVRMLHDDAESIRIEDPGTEKAEFVVTLASHRELHQVKRGHRDGKWSLKDLGATDGGLLHVIGQQLAGNSDRFVFASSSDAAVLRNLCEEASAAESIEEFKRWFLEAGDKKEGFKTLQECWGCDVSTAFDLLRRIDVQTIDEAALKEKLLLGVEALFLADPQKVLVELRAIVRDSVHQTIIREGLVDALKQRGYQLRRLTSSQRARDAVKAATDQYLHGAKIQLIQHRLLPRPSTTMLLAGLEGPATDHVLTGGAGSGKTACVVEVVEAVRERGLPVLAFRLDRLPALSTTEALGRQLDLEESPVLVLAAAAQTAGVPGLLIVDQLDAVSTMSGRSSGAFDLVERLLHEARGTRTRATIHTVVVCRAFDWRNDSRLRRLLPDEHGQVDVTEFTDEEVREFLTNAGFDTAWFRSGQLELLRLPQNLSLFLEAGFDTRLAPAFRTATDLFSRYWDEKRRSVADRVVPSADQWMEVMEILCEEMTSTQQLSVAKERLDTIPISYLDQLASEGVVTFDGRRYGFGHESFFDYCFARVFFNRSDSLVSFLKGPDQHLFRRAQVRQVLAYLRDADSVRYIQELHSLLSDEGIRVHLKDLAFALLAAVVDPTEEEWTIWQEWLAPALSAIEGGLRNANKLSELAWRRFFGAPSWFDVADHRGLVEAWLASDNGELANTALNYLRLHQGNSPDRVAALLEPYADCGGQWKVRLRFFMESADHHTSRRVFDLFLRLVDNGTLDEARGSRAVNGTFWDMLHDLGENRPEWVPEVLAHVLRRRLAIVRAAGEDLRKPDLLGYDASAAEMLGKSAKSAPAVFVKHVLPLVLDISEATVLPGGEPPKHDVVWSYLIKTEHPRGEDACLSGLVAAIGALARDGTANLRDIVADLRSRDTHIANHLLLALYAGGAAHYADEAISLLCDQPWRFQCGFSDSPVWCAMELIKVVLPHCTVESRERLEDVLLRYAAPFERSSAGYKFAGETRFNLLSAFPVKQRSARVNKHLQELFRKFGEPQGVPTLPVAGWVGSPIAKSAVYRMTDEQWLRAIAKYRSEYPTHFGPGDLRGGATQLAQELETRVKEEPDRFARLSLRFPPGTNPVYLELTLSALKGAEVASTLKLEVCRKAFADSRGSCGRSIVALLGSIEGPLPNDAVEMLGWLAIDHEDPVEELWQKDAGGGHPDYNGDVQMDGINTTRGRAADAIRALILADVTYVERFRPALERMIRDRSAAVLSRIAGTLQAVAYHDSALALSLFLCMDLSEERLLATRYVYGFIHGNLRDSFGQLRPIVERMLRSSEPKVATAGARLASLAAVDHDGAGILAVEAVSGSPDQRLGVAQVAAANIGVPRCRSWCEETLRALFDDSHVDVRVEAAACFSNLPDDTLDTFGNLIEAFSVSAAFREDSFSIFHALEASLGRLPGMTCAVCEKFLDRFAKEARDMRTCQAGDTFTLTKLIFRIYQQHQNDEWTSRSLDLIDRLCLEGIGDTAQQFEEFER